MEDRAPASFIELENVTVSRGGRTVLDALSLRIKQGEQVALLGPNGCGKSTLLKLILGELYPLPRPETRVEILGRARWNLAELRRQLGVVGSEAPSDTMLAVSGMEAVLTGFFSSARLWPHLVVTPEMRVRADAELVRVGAAKLADRRVGHMSSGEQRRIVVARALVASAGCLLLDEPSNALDLHAQRDLRDVLVRLAEQGTTILHITHRLEDIIPAIGRVLLMQAGRIVADGPREQLLTEPVLSELFGAPLRLVEQHGFLYALS